MPSIKAKPAADRRPQRGMSYHLAEAGLASFFCRLEQSIIRISSMWWQVLPKDRSKPSSTASRRRRKSLRCAYKGKCKPVLWFVAGNEFDDPVDV